MIRCIFTAKEGLNMKTYIKGSTGGTDHYLVIDEKDGIALAVKPTITYQSSFSIRFRAARLDGERVDQVSEFTEAFPTIPFEAVDKNRASVGFSRTLNASEGQLRMLNPTQATPLIDDAITFILSFGIELPVAKNVELFEHFIRFWAVDPNAEINFTDDGWPRAKAGDQDASDDDLEDGDGEE